MVREARGRNLFFSTDIAAGIRAADIIFVSVNTPTKTFGHGAGMASDLQYWEKTAHEIVAHSDRAKIIVEKSTLPVRTAEAMERILQENKKGIPFEVISNPEFLAEGSAVRDLLEPDRVLIGSRQTETGLRAAREIVDIFAHWVAARADHHHQPVVGRALQAGGQRLPGPAHLVDQRRFGPVREDRRRCRRDLVRRGQRHAASARASSTPASASAAPASRRTS